MKMKTMGELMDQYEAELAANTKAEMAAEDAAWAALTPAQQDKIWEERLERQAARFADLMEFDAEDEDEDEEEEDKEDDQ